MKDWNAIVTARGDQWREARHALGVLGRVDRTGYYNVFAMKVEEPTRFVEGLEHLVTEHPQLADAVAHVFPAERCFDFSSRAEFEAKARETALEWTPRLAGGTFHVRVHRRGRQQVLRSPDEERMLADALLAAIRAAGKSAEVDFDDPDAIVLVETIGGRAGMAVRTRDDRRQHPLLATR